jgi:hypothetical protein
MRNCERPSGNQYTDRSIFQLVELETGIVLLKGLSKFTCSFVLSTGTTSPTGLLEKNTLGINLLWHFHHTATSWKEEAGGRKLVTQVCVSILARECYQNGLLETVTNTMQHANGLTEQYLPASSGGDVSNKEISSLHHWRWWCSLSLSL